MSPHEALVAANGLHAGFQLVVTVLVYPALASTPAASWTEVHDRHSRGILPVVAVVYAAAATACLWVLITGPRDLAEWIALAATAVAAGTTALVAAPTHGRLGVAGPAPALLRRLLRSDRARFAATIVALVAALIS